MASEGFNLHELEIKEVSPCGRYVRYKRVIGRGAFKQVYRGFDLIARVDVAWYQIPIDDVKSGETMCFEAVVLQSLAHKNIMKCYCHWIDHKSKRVNVIAELFSSGNLRQYMKKLGKVDKEMIRNWGRQILQGLNYLHTQKPTIIHRDLKCDNLFLDVENNEIKIGDFGLATFAEGGLSRAVVGTPEFMAAEYYDEEYNELVDVYAFGMCLLEMATQEYPYSECTNPGQIFKKVCSGIKAAAMERVEDVEVKEMINKCLSPAALRPSAIQLLQDPFFSQAESHSPDLVYFNDAKSISSSKDGAELNSMCHSSLICCGVDDMNLSNMSCLSVSMISSSDSVSFTGVPTSHNRLICSGVDDMRLSDVSAVYSAMSTSNSDCRMGSSSSVTGDADSSMHSTVTCVSS